MDVRKLNFYVGDWIYELFRYVRSIDQPKLLTVIGNYTILNNGLRYNVKDRLLRMKHVILGICLVRMMAQLRQRL